jgi:1-acyl-sn-glycerol-3-phosphate acyltransferase
MTSFRSALFAVAFQAWTLLIAVGYLPLLLGPRRVMMVFARVWVRGVMLLLRLIVGLTCEVRGRDHVPAGAVLVASKHQSALETLFFQLVLEDPAFVLKRELQWIPFFGWYLAKTGVIAIDRSAGTKALRAMVKGGEQAKADGRPIIIFPEGTRTPPGTRQPYHSGVAMMYGALGVPTVPVALNSGLFWGRRAFTKRPGVVTIEFLPVIEPGLNRKRFMAELEARIEAATDHLVAEACARFDLPEPKGI